MQSEHGSRRDRIKMLGNAVCPPVMRGVLQIFKPKARNRGNAKTSPPPPGIGLRPRARLLRTLGEELISNEVVAVIEFVKNAYDADATRVLIRFSGPIEIGKGED